MVAELFNVMANETGVGSKLDLGGLSVVLGTSSRWRQKLFASSFPGVEFSTQAADIDETAINAGYNDRGSADPSELTLALAHAKATAILPKLSGDALLITSDQVLSHGGRIREVSGCCCCCCQRRQLTRISQGFRFGIDT